jgi:uncharacterized membrane protein YfcA
VLPPAIGVVASYAAGMHLHRQCLRRLSVGYVYAGGDLRIETTAGIWKYVAWAFGAGLGSGMLGIGGGMILGRVGSFHHVILQSKHKLMTASMVHHVTNLTTGSGNPDTGSAAAGPGG